MEKKTLGSLLRAAREQRKWSREYLARQINIHTHLLTKIENSEYDKLPPMAYTRGFIASLAQHLDLDKEKILQLFNQESDFKHVAQRNLSPKVSPVIREAGVFKRLGFVPLYTWLRGLRTLLVLSSLVAVVLVGVQMFRHYDGVSLFLQEAETSKRLPASPAQKLKDVFPKSRAVVQKGVWQKKVFMKRALKKETSTYLLNTQFDKLSFRYLTRSIDRAAQPKYQSHASSVLLPPNTRQ